MKTPKHTKKLKDSSIPSARARGGRSTPGTDSTLRDVGKQSTGPRLQRLRATLFLVNATAGYPDTVAWAGVELQGDVFTTTAGADGLVEQHEENKNYAPTTQFTLNSHEVLNALITFCDCWIHKLLSSSVRFAFYCPNNFAQERATLHTRQLGIEFPDGPVLGFLSRRELGHPKVVAAVRAAVIAEYEEQLKNDPESVSTPRRRAANPANLATIKTWDHDQWMNFLRQIEWKFGQEDAATIEQSVIDAIQRSPCYSAQIAGQEQTVIALLLNLLDKRQSACDPIQRLVHVAEAQLVFKNVESGDFRLPDPAWQLWQQLTKPADTRNLANKVTAVCPDIHPTDLEIWSRRAAHSLLEQRELADDKIIACETVARTIKGFYRMSKDGGNGRGQVRAIVVDDEREVEASLGGV